ncbi:MAG: NAD(P)H-dependent oxidoreductase [Clostridia bacterium]|nr:NAD(P)H-dependent oxidoreductase [Clostridia bacterium]
MKLLIINGSPKPGKNNTAVLLKRFIEGFKGTKGNEVEIFRMNNEQAYKEAAIRFETAEAVLLAFPLYSYAMPAGVKTFIEELEPLLGKCHGKKVGFLVQYGFIEAVHARALETYLEYISGMLCCDYLGTIIKGGCDGLTKSEKGNRKIRMGAYEIGKTFGATGCFNKKQLDDYSAPEVQKKQNSFLLSIIIKIINKVYWEKAFKKNGVTYEGSFAKPYGK